MVVFNFQNKVIKIKNDYLIEFSKKVVHHKIEIFKGKQVFSKNIIISNGVQIS